MLASRLGADLLRLAAFLDEAVVHRSEEQAAIIWRRHDRQAREWARSGKARFLVFPGGQVMDRRHDLAVDVRWAMVHDLPLARGLVELYQRAQQQTPCAVGWVPHRPRS